MNGVTATRSAPNQLDIFWLDSQFAVQHESGNGTQWGFGSDNLAGIFTTVPAAVASDTTQPNVPRRLDVFGLGLDYRMWHKRLEGTQWTPNWEDLGGIFISSPAAIARPGDLIDVFGVGLDFAMYHKVWNGRWSPAWQRLGGTFSSAASIVSSDPARIDVFARGADFTLRHRSLTGSTWFSEWQNLGGSLASPPVAISWGPNRMDVFAVWTDGGLWHRWWDGNIWNDWESLGGSFTASPSAVTWSPDRLDVFALGTDGNIYHYWFLDQAWNGREVMSFGAQDIGGGFTSGPTAISPAFNRINLLAPAINKNLYHLEWNGTQWTPGWAQVPGGQFRLPTRYRFSVDNVHVTQTRALHSDTDTAQASIAAWNWGVQNAVQKLGDLGGIGDPNDSQPNQLHFEPITVELCETALFNYLVVNNDHADQKALDSALTKAGTSLTSGSVKSISNSLAAGVGAIVGIELVGGIVAPIIGSLLGSLVGWLLEQVGDVIFADCDGIVAAELISYLGRDLHLKTANGGLSVTTTHHGTDSNDGCGGNSQYEVTWTITRV